VRRSAHTPDWCMGIRIYKNFFVYANTWNKGMNYKEETA